MIVINTQVAGSMKRHRNSQMNKIWAKLNCLKDNIIAAPKEERLPGVQSFEKQIEWLETDCTMTHELTKKAREVDFMQYDTLEQSQGDLNKEIMEGMNWARRDIAAKYLGCLREVEAAKAKKTAAKEAAKAAAEPFSIRNICLVKMELLTFSDTLMDYPSFREHWMAIIKRELKDVDQRYKIKWKEILSLPAELRSYIASRSVKFL